MSFTEPVFLIFLLAVLALYWPLRSARFQNGVLLLASYVFYGWVQLWFPVLLAGETLFSYLLLKQLVRSTRHRQIFFYLCLAVNLIPLLLFKVGPVFAPLNSGWLIPIGISFYTFKLISFTIDTARRPREINFLNYALYIAFFPQINSGPIDRATRLFPQFETVRCWRMDHLKSALPLLVMGLVKKMVIANNISHVVDQVFQLENPSKLMLYAGAAAFALLILADFSAYTDLSRGVALLLGIETSPNFNFPYLALSPTDFWNRWHITLSEWLRTYIYFPLSRKWKQQHRPQNSIFIWLLPPLITMLVSGLWHGTGWNFLLWGAYYGLLIALYQRFGLATPRQLNRNWKRLFAWAVMFHLILFGWLIFKSGDLSWLARGIFNAPWGITGRAAIAPLSVLSQVLVYSLPLGLKWLADLGFPRFPVLRPAYFSLALVLLVIFSSAQAGDFIYFQF
jgi:alginate O-acetyltransferase complex protein AlgI